MISDGDWSLTTGGDGWSAMPTWPNSWKPWIPRLELASQHGNIMRVFSHVITERITHCLHNSTGREVEACARCLLDLPYVPFSLADFRLSPFTAINYIRSKTALLNVKSPSSKSLNLRLLWGTLSPDKVT